MDPDYFFGEAHHKRFHNVLVDELFIRQSVYENDGRTNARASNVKLPKLHIRVMADPCSHQFKIQGEVPRKRFIEVSAGSKVLLFSWSCCFIVEPAISSVFL